MYYFHFATHSYIYAQCKNRVPKMIQFLYPVKAEDWVTFFYRLPPTTTASQNETLFSDLYPSAIFTQYIHDNKLKYIFIFNFSRRVEISSSSKVSIVFLCVMKVFDWLEEYPSNKSSSITRTRKTKKIFHFLDTLTHSICKKRKDRKTKQTIFSIPPTTKTPYQIISNKSSITTNIPTLILYTWLLYFSCKQR